MFNTLCFTFEIRQDYPLHLLKGFNKTKLIY